MLDWQNAGTGQYYFVDNVSVKEVGQDWTFGTSWSMGDGVAISDGGSSYLTDSVSSGFISGKKYRVSLEIVEYNSGTVSLPFDGAGANTNYQNSIGVKTADITAQNNSPIYVLSQGFDGTIDNISVKEVTDDTDLPRINYEGFTYENGLPVPYSGVGSWLFEGQRTNLVTQSEDYSSNLLVNSSIESNNTISPDGTQNATLLKEDTNSGNHALREAANTSVAADDSQYVISFFAKSNGRNIRFIDDGICWKWYYC